MFGKILPEAKDIPSDITAPNFIPNVEELAATNRDLVIQWADRQCRPNRGHPISFTFDALNAYHGGGFPGGVTHAFKAMQRAFPLSDTPLERREVTIVPPSPDPAGGMRWEG